MKRDLLGAEPNRPSDENPKTIMGTCFYGHTGKPCDKWNHYLDVYDRHLDRYIDAGVRLLEIGVQRGGSLQVWRRYLGQRACIHGLDIDPECAAHSGDAGKVHIGDQADAGLLRSIEEEMGGIDVVIDDGGHHCAAQIASFETLYPLLSEDGVYICEDTHTSYWPEYGGGLQRSGSFIEYAKDLVDHMHEWWHGKSGGEEFARMTKGIFFYDSMVVFEKGRRGPPTRTIAGTK